MGLLEPLNTEKGRIIIMEVLHQVYFALIKSYLIFLLRSVTREASAILSINNCVYSLKMFVTFWPLTIYRPCLWPYTFQYLHYADFVAFLFDS